MSCTSFSFFKFFLVHRTFIVCGLRLNFNFFSMVRWLFCFFYSNISFIFCITHYLFLSLCFLLIFGRGMFTLCFFLKIFMFVLFFFMLSFLFSSMFLISFCLIISFYNLIFKSFRLWTNFFYFFNQLFNQFFTNLFMIVNCRRWW